MPRQSAFFIFCYSYEFNLSILRFSCYDCRKENGHEERQQSVGLEIDRRTAADCGGSNLSTKRMKTLLLYALWKYAARGLNTVGTG